MEIRFSLENKWIDPKKDEKYSKYNASVGTITYKLAMWPTGIVHLVFPQYSLVQNLSCSVPKNMMKIER